MIDVDLAIPFSAGMIAAFNPCGFAMMPAYLSYFLGLESEEETDAGHNIFRGLLVGLTLTAAFVLFFGVIGLITTNWVSQSAVQTPIAWITLILGILLVPLGLAMVFGYQPKLNLPRMNRGGKTRDLPSIFGFGLSYAVVSLGCTAPVFFATVVGSFTQESLADGTAVFVAYAVGMSTIIMALTLSVAMARTSVAKHMKQMLRYVNRVSGVLVIGAGILLAFYGWWERQVLHEGNTTASNPLVDLQLQLNARLEQWVADVGAGQLGVAISFFLGGAILFALRKQMSKAERQLVGGAFVVTYLVVEFVHYQAELLVLPVLRTIADVPERVGNWFVDPLRWPVLFEVMLAVVVAAIVTFVILMRRRSAVEPAAEAPAPELTPTA